MLGDLSPPDTTVIWTDAGNDNISSSVTPSHQHKAPSHDIPATPKPEGCYKELSRLCNADARTMNTTLCLACVATVSSHFKACSTHRATAICTNPRSECTAALDSLCKGDRRKGPAQCEGCVRDHAHTLFSSADNCTVAATAAYCGAPAPSPPGPSPPGPSPPGECLRSAAMRISLLSCLLMCVCVRFVASLHVFLVCVCVCVCVCAFPENARVIFLIHDNN